jgi:RNA polymerase sigma-70 factor (ECF subfamily)
VVERDALQTALNLLPPDFRTALVLREYADMTYADIAAYQSVGVQTVKSRLNRARHAVQLLLAQEA